jgi:chemotaxis protein CheD
MLQTISVADIKISSDPEDVLITHALGSCLGITIYDFKKKVGGMLHCMLPDSTIDRNKAQKNPAMFVDSGMKLLLGELLKTGSEKKHLVIKAVGGSSSKIKEEDDFFQIGRRNFVSLRKFLWENGLLLKAHDIGGFGSRTVSLRIDDGEVIVKINGTMNRL